MVTQWENLDHIIAIIINIMSFYSFRTGSSWCWDIPLGRATTSSQGPRRCFHLICLWLSWVFYLFPTRLYHSNIQFSTKCVHPSTEAFANAPQSSYNHWCNLNLFQRPKPFQLSLQILILFSLFSHVSYNHLV